MSFPFPRPFPGPSMVSFSVLSLFAAGEQGAWYDPSDFSTMFQDSAGTTPVTAVEQPVGLILDKSKGLALGSELITNGDFASGTTGWTNASIGTGTFTVSSSIATLIGVDASNRGALLQGITCVVGTTYKVTATVSGGSLNIAVGTGVLLDGTGGVSVTQTGAASFVVVASATSLNLKAWNIGAGGTVTIDNISVKALPGNHASQSTAASRPVLSARVNLLTYSEQFDNAAWTKASCAASANSTVAPDGASTADTITAAAAAASHYVTQSITAWAAAVHTVSVYAKRGTQQFFQITTFDGTTSRYANFDIQNGTVGTTSNATSSISDAGNGWYRCTLQTSTAQAAAGGNITLAFANSSSAPANTSYTTAGTETFYLWGADLRVTNDGVGLPPYQRVAAATDYDTSGFPLYLAFDGTDDSLATASIDFSATDKMSVFAGVRKLSDATTFAIVAELSASWSTNNGTFILCHTGGSAGTTYAGSRGAGPAGASVSPTGFTPPIGFVTSVLASISTDEFDVRSNGAALANSTSDQGTGNYGNYPLYLGRRGGSTLPFTGRLYSLIVRGALSTDAQIEATERWVNNVTGAY